MANILTPYFRVSYPNVFKARKNDLSGKEEFSVMALFPKGTDLTALKKAAQEAIAKKWGTDQKKWPKNLRTPFRKHEEKKYENDDGMNVFPQGMEEGGVFVNLKSSQRPRIAQPFNDPSSGKVAELTVESDFYAGCWARASVNAWAYEVKGNSGVSFGLGNIQKVREGDPLGSRTKAEDDFQPIEGAAISESASASDIFG